MSAVTAASSWATFGWPAARFSADRRRASLMPSAFSNCFRPALQRRRQVFVDIARHLAELHERALHGPQLFGHLLRRAQRELVAQLLAPVHRCEDKLGRSRRVAA